LAGIVASTNLAAYLANSRQPLLSLNADLTII
jgi:hypothetical protein